MITCRFENGTEAYLRHVVLDTLVEREKSLLLVKRAEQLIEGGKWALPGGYLSRNETVFQGAIRELEEETGWTGEIKSLFRITSNPDRPAEDRQNVVLSFIVKPTQKIGESDTEVQQMMWVQLDKIDTLLDTMAFDHGSIVSDYLKYREKQFPLPIII